MAICGLKFVLAAVGMLLYGVKPDESNVQLIQCPGVCMHVDHAACVSTLNETDCGENFVCCLPNITSSDVTDSTSSDSVWEGSFHSIDSSTSSSTEATSIDSGWGSFADKVGLSATDSSEERLEVSYTEKPQFLDSLMSETTGSPLSTLVYEENFASAIAEEYGNIFEGTEISRCPGHCLKNEYSSYCQYIMPIPELCDENKTCCITEREALRISRQTKEELEPISEEISDVQGRIYPDMLHCPGQCVHPSRAIFCQKILNQYPCPLNSKCCLHQVQTSVEPDVQPIKKCEGQCIPNHILNLCYPPNEIIPGTVNCRSGTTCCVLSAGATGVTGQRRPSPQSILFPRPRQDQAESTIRVNEHIQLAEDTDGILYQVDASGNAKLIARLPQTFPQYGPTIRLVTTISRPEGRLFIVKDPYGNLYQEYEAAFAHRLLQRPYTRSEDKFSESDETEDESSEVKSEVDDSSDIVIPDEDDELPASDNTTVPPTVVPDSVIPNPICPGKCTSYILRLTCFGSYAVYDGFFCPGSSVCCAHEKDIENHEIYLKTLSMSPNTPRTSKGLSEPNCGIKGHEKTKPSSKILPGEWCWQVAILNAQNQYVCGGVIIDSLWVVTAAHCVSGFMNERQTLFVRAGVADLTSEEENSLGQTRRVLTAYIHQDHNSMTLDNDIALLQLQNPFLLNANICVVCMPSNSDLPPEGTICTTTGYGFISRSGSMALKINEANIPLVHDMDCIANVTEALSSVFILPASSFCAGGHGKKDSCQADAGGPLVCEIDGLNELTGLVSWGLGCGVDQVPSIYVKVPAFVGWINQIINYTKYLKTMT